MSAKDRQSPHPIAQAEIRRSRELETFMADEKTQGSGAATVEAPGPNTVRVTFLPDNKTFEFEHGKLPYQDTASRSRFSTWR